jgi:sRNA-binding carbon storage regulator CsrA
MLVLTRKLSQLLTIEPEVDLPPELSVGEIFEQGPILIVVKRIDRGQVSLGIEAPRCLRIDRVDSKKLAGAHTAEPAVRTPLTSPPPESQSPS